MRPRENIKGGTSYLASLLDRFDGRLEWALAAYNAGPGAVERHGGVPPYPETKRFVEKVLDAFRRQGGGDELPSREPDKGVDTAPPG